MDRLYVPSDRAEHTQHPIQLLLFASSLGIDRMPQSAKGRFIESANRGLHKFPTSSSRKVHSPYSRGRRGA
jgi:hypothetical protein